MPRENLLDAALRVFSDTKLLQEGILEIVFEDEEGSGLGPTLEFYSLISKEIQNLKI